MLSNFDIEGDAMADKTNANETVFRKETLERISSPEQLTDYLRITNPGIWVILSAVILLLAGLFAWSMIGTLETTATVKVIVSNDTAQIVPIDTDIITEGMVFRVNSEEYTVALAENDDLGRYFGMASVDLPDGIYDGTIVVDQVHPIDFLLNNK